MKVLVLGATGMLGHQVYKHLRRDTSLEVIGTCREPDVRIQKKMYGETFPVFDAFVPYVEARLQDLYATYGGFDYIINSIGVIKPAINEENPLCVAQTIRINAEFPHRLAAFCSSIGGKIIHPSTDCVFSGRGRKSYKEDDVPDATDVYGRTKILGECPTSMNIRTSIVGPEINTKRSLLEWFLSKGSGTVNGYTNHLWNGMTTLQWAKIVHNIIVMDRWKPGIRHFYSLPVSKADLLMIFKKEFIRADIVTPEVEPIKAKEDKCMLLKTNYPVYLGGFAIPHLIDQVRVMVQVRYGGK